MILFLISITLIVGSLATILLVHIPAIQYSAAALCLVGVGLMYHYWHKLANSILADAKNDSESLRLQINQLKEQNEKNSEENEKLATKMSKMRSIPQIDSNCRLSEGIAALRDYFTPDITGNQSDLYNRLFALMDDAENHTAMLTAIGNNLTNSVIEEVKDSELPLNEEKRRALLARLVELGLVAVDLTKGYRSSWNSKDSIAIRRAMNDITDEEALREAKNATNNVYETANEIRVLKALVEGLGKGTYIVKDYKL